MHPEVKASLALDHKSILLQPRNAKSGAGWWLRNDAPEVSLEPATRLEGGRPHPTHQVVLRCMLGRGGTARIRWKLSRADRWPTMAPDAPPAEKAAPRKSAPRSAPKRAG
ncbi:MAG: heparinase II/III family protein [Caulobacteraceae bacterium]